MRRSMVIGCLLALGAAAGARAQSNTTVITSDEMTFDYKRSLATFDRNVKVVDPQLTLQSDALIVTFDSTNSVKSVTATGRVRLWQADKKATCNKAVYVAKSGEITLTGDVVVTRAADSLTTEEVVFWVNEDRMKCPQRATVVISQQTQDGDKPRIGSKP